MFDAEHQSSFTTNLLTTGYHLCYFSARYDVAQTQLSKHNLFAPAYPCNCHACCPEATNSHRLIRPFDPLKGFFVSGRRQSCLRLLFLVVVSWEVG